MDPLNPLQIPQGAQAGPPDMVDQQMVTPEEKQVLLALIQKIKDSLSNLQAQSFAGNDKNDMNRRELLQQVFSKLQLVGVDLTDRQSVADFIDNLRQQSPELADQFEKAMSVLLGEEDVSTPEEESINMNQQNETPSQTV